MKKLFAGFIATAAAALLTAGSASAQCKPQAGMPDPVNRSEDRPERRGYTHVNNEKRNELIKLLESKTTIKNAEAPVAVSYTHLTLPTKREV